MFSIIVPLDTDRLELFARTKRIYEEYPQKKEFIIPTRRHMEVRKYLVDNKLMQDVKIIPYELSHGFNVSKALNIGVRESQYPQIIITSPEVLPRTDVLPQLEKLIGENVICQVFDEDNWGDRSFSLVSHNFRSSTPAMYFLAMFNKKDIEAINGWDEDFTKGYAYEDNDFGDRWVRAGLPFRMDETIQAVHQYHPRIETVSNGTNINLEIYTKNTANGVTQCSNGLLKL